MDKVFARFFALCDAARDMCRNRSRRDLPVIVAGIGQDALIDAPLVGYALATKHAPLAGLARKSTSPAGPVRAAQPVVSVIRVGNW